MGSPCAAPLPQVAATTCDWPGMGEALGEVSHVAGLPAAAFLQSLEGSWIRSETSRT